MGINSILDSLGVSPFLLMLTTGTVGMLICMLNRRARFSLSALQCVFLTLLLTVVGVLGAKLLFILENIRDTLENGISLGGVSFFGSVFLIPLMMPLVGKLFRLKPGQTMDICGPCVAVMIGCLRFNCVLSNCCGGWEVSLGNVCFPWPTQAMDSIGDFMILSLLLKWEQEGKFQGKLYPLFMLFYGGMRFLIEFLRDTPKDWLYLSHGHWFSLIAIVTAAFWIGQPRGERHE